MSKINRKLEIFRSTLDAISINQGGLTKCMYQSISKKTRDYVSRKYSSTVEFISRDTVIIQVLQKLEDEGYNLASVEFDTEGKITQREKS